MDVDDMMQLMLDRHARVMERYNEALEEACEKALQAGQHGVLVVHTAPGEWLLGPHPSVPYGTIHEFPQGMLPSTAHELGLSEGWWLRRG